MYVWGSDGLGTVWYGNQTYSTTEPLVFVLLFMQGNRSYQIIVSYFGNSVGNQVGTTRQLIACAILTLGTGHKPLHSREGYSLQESLDGALH